MKKRLRKIIVAAIIFLIAVFIEKIHFINIDKNIISMIQIGLYVLSYLIVGFEVVKNDGYCPPLKAKAKTAQSASAAAVVSAAARLSRFIRPLL